MGYGFEADIQRQPPREPTMQCYYVKIGGMVHLGLADFDGRGS